MRHFAVHVFELDGGVVDVKLVPQALQLPSPRALEQVNLELWREISDREHAQSAVARVPHATALRDTCYDHGAPARAYR